MIRNDCAHHIDHISRKRIQGIFTKTRHRLFIKYAGSITGINHHHIPIRVGAIVFDSYPGGILVGPVRIISNQVDSIRWWSKGTINIAWCDFRIRCENIGSPTTKVSVGKNIFA